MNTKEVTLGTIAKCLNLSRYSVSRALSGKNGVSEETRQAVFKIAQELGYQHHAIKEEGSNIMLLIPQDSAYNSEFWINVIGGAEQEAERLGFNLITRPLLQGAAHTVLPLKRQIHGLIGVGHRSRELVEIYAEAGIPITLITHPKPLETFDTVTTRNWEGGFVVGQHLVELGHRKITFVTDITDELTREERLRGLKDAVRGYSTVEVNELRMHLDHLGEEFERVFAPALNDRSNATAIFCSLDVIAFYVIWALNRLGLKVPQDVSVVGFTDCAQASQFVPKLTTVHSPMRHLGIAAMQNVFRQIESKGSSGLPRHISIAPKLILRESTAQPPGRTDEKTF